MLKLCRELWYKIYLYAKLVHQMMYAWDKDIKSWLLQSESRFSIEHNIKAYFQAKQWKYYISQCISLVTNIRRQESPGQLRKHAKLFLKIHLRVDIKRWVQYTSIHELSGMTPFMMAHPLVLWVKEGLLWGVVSSSVSGNPKCNEVIYLLVSFEIPAFLFLRQFLRVF